MPNRGAAFRQDELKGFLKLLEEYLPIGSDEWDAVEYQHNNNFPGRNRTKETLKRKFQLMYLMKPPTGNPTIPPTVRKAKDIFKLIKLKAEVSEGESENSEDEKGIGSSDVDSEDPDALGGDDDDNDANNTSSDEEDLQVVEVDKVQESLQKEDGVVAPTDIGTGASKVACAKKKGSKPSKKLKTGTKETKTKKKLKNQAATATDEGKKMDDKSFVTPVKSSFLSTPVVRTKVKSESGDSMKKYFELMFMQKQMEREDRKEEQKERYEYKRLLREEERQRRFDDEQRSRAYNQQQLQLQQQQQQQQQQLMQAMMLSMMNQSQNSNNNSNQQLLNMVLAKQMFGNGIDMNPMSSGTFSQLPNQYIPMNSRDMIGNHAPPEETFAPKVTPKVYKKYSKGSPKKAIATTPKMTPKMSSRRSPCLNSPKQKEKVTDVVTFHDLEDYDYGQDGSKVHEVMDLTFEDASKEVALEKIDEVTNEGINNTENSEDETTNATEDTNKLIDTLTKFAEKKNADQASALEQN